MKNSNIVNEFDSYLKKEHRIPSTQVDAYKKHTVNYLTPYIIEERPLNVAQMDVFSRLMMDRIIFLGMPVSDEVANIIIAQLLFLESIDSSRDIQMYINSPGGSLYAGMGMYDTMQYIKPDIATICVGMAASMSAVLLASGASLKRTALKHSRIMLHQPSGAIGGQATDILITAFEIKKLKQELYEVIANHTKQPIDKIHKDCERDFWMTSEEAKIYGLVDEVLVNNTK